MARESRLALDCKGSRLLSLHGQNLQPAPTDLAECEVLAEQVQAQWNLGLDPIPNLTQLLEQHTAFSCCSSHCPLAFMG